MSDRHNRCYGKAVLAEGSAANKFKTTTNTITYTIKGRAYTKAAAEDLVFSSGHTALGASQICAFGVMLDTSGNVTTVQGPIKTVGNTDKVLPLPFCNSADKCLIGYIIVQTSSSGVFTPNSTDLGDAQVTDTYIDCDGEPSQTVTLY